MGKSSDVLTKKELAIVHASVRSLMKEEKGAADAATIKDAFKATERRLYALPILEKKIKNDKGRLLELQQQGPGERTTSIVRFQRTGYRADPEQMLDAVIQDLESKIAADEYEAGTVRRAMEAFVDNYYYPTVTGRYIDRWADEDIAEDLNCSTVTVWKRRNIIVKDISVMLYGSDAI